MLDRVMGGRGSSINKVDNLTEIETKIMSNLFEKAFSNLRDAWESVAEIDPVLTEFEVNPQFLQMVSPNDTVVVISLNTQVADSSGMINICIPHMVLEPIMPRLSVHYWMQTQQKERIPQEIEALENRIKLAQLPIIAELGTSTITIQEFLQLGVGDVIQLDQTIQQPLIVKIGGIPKYIAQPGKVNKRLAVQIIDAIRKEEENDDW
jgi:flagellar motor switch protein FliM